MIKPKTDADEDLRRSLSHGDILDVQYALIRVVQEHQDTVTEMIQKRLEDFASFDEEVLDRVLERALAGAGKFMTNNEQMDEHAGSAAWIGRFIDDEMTALQLLMGFVGTRQRGIVSEIFRRETARAQKVSGRCEIGIGDAFDLSGATRLSYRTPDVILEASEASANLAKALGHLKPEGRLAIALLYDVDGICGVTDPRKEKSDRAKMFKELLITFGFSPAIVGKLMRRFEAISSEIESCIQLVDDSDSRTPVRRDGVFTQKQVAYLLDVSPTVVSRLIKASFKDIAAQDAA